MLPPSEPPGPQPFRASHARNAYRDLTLEPAPRHITLAPIAKLALVVPVLLFGIFYRNLVAVLGHPRQADSLQLLLLFGIPVLLAITARLVFESLVQRSLLKTGCYSVGAVTAKQKASLWSFGKAAIAFEFSVGGHKPMTGRGFDWTGRYSPNRPVLAFYDPGDISRYVAICSTPWRVRTQSGALFAR